MTVYDFINITYKKTNETSENVFDDDLKLELKIMSKENEITHMYMFPILNYLNDTKLLDMCKKLEIKYITLGIFKCNVYLSLNCTNIEDTL